MSLFVVVVAAALVLILIVSLVNGVDLAGLSIVFTLGLGLLVILAPRLERKATQPKSPLPDVRARPVEGLNPACEVRGFLFVAAFVCYGLALQQLLTPDTTPSTGRWSGLMNLFMGWLGPFGPALLSFLAGTVLVVSAIRRTSIAMALKRPPT